MRLLHISQMAINMLIKMKFYPQGPAEFLNAAHEANSIRVRKQRAGVAVLSLGVWGGFRSTMSQNR